MTKDMPAVESIQTTKVHLGSAARTWAFAARVRAARWRNAAFRVIRPKAISAVSRTSATVQPVRSKSSMADPTDDAQAADPLSNGAVPRHPTLSQPPTQTTIPTMAAFLGIRQSYWTLRR